MFSRDNTLPLVSKFVKNLTFFKLKLNIARATRISCRLSVEQHSLLETMKTGRRQHLNYGMQNSGNL